MHAGQKLLDLLFDEGEEVCVSPDGYGYKSIKLDDLSKGPFVLEPQTEKQKPTTCKYEDIQLISINPIKGSRNDENVTAYRSFLIEMDDGSLASQLAYINALKVPYSACVFSGNKSLHFAITLSAPLPSEQIWRFYAEWILKVVDRADQQTKNPSRGIRMAGNIRNGGKEMKLIEIKDRIQLEKLQNWLSKYEGLKPIMQKKERAILNSDLNLSILPEWVQSELIMGINFTKGRNNRWFAIAYECALQGWPEDDIMSMLEGYFQEERDFSRKEWETAIKSAYKKANKI